MREAATVQVWDPIVRIAHWLLAVSVILAWLTRHAPGAWHEWIGYGSLALVALFSAFVRSPNETLRYAHGILARREARYLGHNPLGGWMVVALLLAVTLVGFTGWLYTTERFWGVEWVERLHSTLADALLVLAALHVTGVVFASLRHRENLIGSMVHGRKRT